MKSVRPRPRPSWAERFKLRPLWVLLLSLALLQSAYLILTADLGKTVSWRTAQFPVQFRLWSGFSDAAPSVVAGSRPHAAIRQALDQWARSSSLSFALSTTSQSRAGQDGTNLITISDEPANRDLVGGRLAVALIWSRQSGATNEIFESDIVFNPQHREPWSTIEAKDTLNIFDVAVHEIGHTLGLEHSISRSSRMFFQGGAYGYGFNPLTSDDVAGINQLYPLPGYELLTGSISGRVTINGSPVFGAFVVAADEEGSIEASSISLRDGSYEIAGLAPGKYIVYAEPLDGPTTAYNLTGGLFNPPHELETNFRPTFYRGSMSPQVNVAAASTSGGIDIAVTSGRTQLDPEWVGTAPNPRGSSIATTTSAPAGQGSSTQFIVGGKGVEKLPNNDSFSVLGAITSSGDVADTQTASDLLFKFFPIAIDRGIPLGQYSVILKDGADRGLVTGGLQVFSPYRYNRSFGHFAHIPGALRSKLFLINLEEGEEVDGRVVTVDEEGRSQGVNLTSLTSSQNQDIYYSLPPRGSLVDQSAGTSEFRGWLEAEAKGRLAGALLIETDLGTTGIGAGRPTQSFVAPIEIAGSGSLANTGIALANTDQRPALLFVQVLDESGRQRASRLLEFEGRAQQARFVGELLNVPLDSEGGFRGTLQVTANRRLLATVIRTSPGVFTTFPVIQNGVSSRRIFAQFAQAGSLQSELILVNPSPLREATAVEVQVRDSAGNAASVTLNGRSYPSGRLTVSIPPLGSVNLRSGGAPVTGWVEVNSLLPVGGIVLFSSPDLGTAGVGESPLSDRLVVPLDRNSQSADTGIALVNGESRTVTVTLTAYDSVGNQTGNVRRLTLSPRQHLARFPDDPELDLGLPRDFTGSLWVKADGKVALTAIRQSPGVLTTFPATSLELPFTPSMP